MSDQEGAILARFERSLVERLALDPVVLFGSRARGDAEGESGMDVLVVFRDAVHARGEDYVKECAWAAGVEQGIVLVPGTVSREEMGRRTTQLVAAGNRCRAGWNRDMKPEHVATLVKYRHPWKWSDLSTRKASSLCGVPRLSGGICDNDSLEAKSVGGA